MSKSCKKCGAVKSLKEFSIDRRNPDGRQSRCKACNAEYRRGNINQVRSYARDYHKKNADEIRARKRARYKQNSAAILKKSAERTAERPGEKRAARAVRNAVKRGVLIKPNMCSDCGKDCVPEAHHFSYHEEHLLHARWMCRSCHRLLHTRQSRLKAQYGPKEDG